MERREQADHKKRKNAAEKGTKLKPQRRSAGRRRRTTPAVHKDEDEDEEEDEDGGGGGDGGDDDDDNEEKEEMKLVRPAKYSRRTKNNTRERWCARSEENDSSTSLESDSSRAIGCRVTKGQKERERETERGRSA